MRESKSAWESITWKDSSLFDKPARGKGWQQKIALGRKWLGLAGLVWPWLGLALNTTALGTSGCAPQIVTASSELGARFLGELESWVTVVRDLLEVAGANSGIYST